MIENDKSTIREFNMPDGNIIKKLTYVMSFVGAGSVLMSAAMGPGTLSSMMIAGSDYGYMLLWIVLLSGVMNGIVAYVGGKAACLSGKNVYEYLGEKINMTFAKVLLSVVLLTWIMVIFSQGSAMLQTVQFLIGTTGPISIIAFIVIEIIAAYVFTHGKNSATKIASVMVTLVSVLFLINLFVVKPGITDVLGGVVPKLPPLSNAIIIAGIIGGSAPGTSAAWYSYGVKDAGWTNPKNLKFIAWDQIYFALLFTVFCIGAYISAAEVLHPAGIQVNSALDAAGALEPIAGSFAKWIFSLGFFGALFTTVGGMCSLFGQGVITLLNMGSDKEYDSSINNSKVKNVIWVGICISILGGFAAKYAMGILVNFLGLLNVGGFVIILALTYFTGSEKHAGKYKNSLITSILCVIITLFNFYSVITYIGKFL